MTHTRNPRRPLALAFAMAMIAIASPRDLAAQTLKHGDVNGDGVVSALDAQAILTAVVSLPLPTGFVAANGDANCDNQTTALDAQIVLSHVIGLNVTQYCVAQTFGPGAITVTLTPTDTSILINRGLRFRAMLRDSAGFAVQRPVSWTTSSADLVRVDSARGDTAWVSNHGAAYDATATLTATADGVVKSTTVRVYRSYAGIIIQPQKPDTLRQLNAQYQFTARSRDSLGVVSGYPNAFWTIDDTTIATVPSAVSNSPLVTVKTTGATWLRATNSSNPADKDSVHLIVALPAINTCTGTGGTLHQSTTYSGPQTWSASTNPHYISGGIYFDSTSTLTIEPGALICANYGAQLTFKAGSRLTALGTQAQPIVFTTTNPSEYWYGIQLGDAYGYVTTPLRDTSRLRNVLFERAYDGAVVGREQHVVLMDSVKIRQSEYGALTLLGPGSTLIHGIIDTITSPSTGYVAVTLGRGSLQESVVRPGQHATGIEVYDQADVRQVSIIGGSFGITEYYYYYYYYGSPSPRLRDISITNTDSVALSLPYGIDTASANVTITGGKSGAFYGDVSALATLFPDTIRQQQLLNNGKDTLFITGGTMSRRTVHVRPDLPWVVDGTVYVDTLAQLVVLPGANLFFSYGSLVFQHGGTLSAIGTPSSPIRFAPLAAGGTFYGLRFDSPGAGSVPSLAPVVTSTMSYVRVDSAYSSGNNDGVCCYSAAINTGKRHRLLMDSVIVRKSYYAGVVLSAKDSYLKRSMIDTTGAPYSNYTSSYPALVLGDTVLVENTIVRRSGNVGVYVAGHDVDLRNVRVTASQSAAISVDYGSIAPTSTNVRADSVNAYPFYGDIQNLALLAPDSLTQATMFGGNLDSLFVITGGNLVKDTVEAAQGFRWRFDAWTYIDTGAVLRALPGANLTFAYNGLQFLRGGTLSAVGTPSRFVHFQPAPGGYFYGLRFDSPGPGANPALAPTAVSTMTYVRVDSASGQGSNDGLGYSGAVNTGARHRVLMDSVIIHKAQYAAVVLSTKGSYLKRATIDTTGYVGSNWTTSQAAVILGDSTLLENSVVRNSGQNGVYIPGALAKMTNVRVVASKGAGIVADYQVISPTTTNVRADSANAYAFYGRIENLAILAPDSLSQVTNFGAGNTDSLIVVSGGTLTFKTVDAIQRIPWRMDGWVYVDTAAQIRATPGARLSFAYNGMQFQRGGTLNAVGTPSNFVHFQPAPGGYFYGLRFDSPGPGANPALAPTAVSTMTYVRVDSASGQGSNDGLGYSAAVNTGARHRLLMDSVIIHKAQNAAVVLSTKGSYLKRATIDTTGYVGSNWTTSQPAVILGDSTLLENTLVFRSGQHGVWVPGALAKMTNVRIVASKGAAIVAADGRLDTATANVRADSANGYVFYGKIDNFAIVAPDSLAQETRFTGNVDSLVVISGGTLQNDTVTAIKPLRWRVESNWPTVDVNARLVAMPGARIAFSYAGMQFLNGGTLMASGTSTDTIRFFPNPGAQFYGMRFDNPTAGVAYSSISYARVDSANGVGSSYWGGSAAINSSERHQLTIDNTVIHKAWNGAVWLGANGSSLNNVSIDTTGNPGGLTTSYAAVHLNDSTTAWNVTVRRSGQTGIFIVGRSISMSNVRVVDSRSYGIHIYDNSATGSRGLFLNGFVVDSGAGIGVAIEADSVHLSWCQVENNGSHGIATLSNYRGVVISNCDLVANTGNGVDNYQKTDTNYVIIANNNWWGDPQGPFGTSPGGDGASTNVSYAQYPCSTSCSYAAMAPMGGGTPFPPMIPPATDTQNPLVAGQRRRRARSRRRT